MKKNQPAKTQIKDIAEKLGLSTGTVSVVLNGRGDSVRIAKETQRKIQELAKEMNYQPNIYARRLRQAAQEETTMVIAVFWLEKRLDIRLASFLSGLHKAIASRGLHAEIVLQPYEQGRIMDHAKYLNSNRYTGAMIGGLSEQEQADLEAVKFNIPIILIGRDTRKLHCVLMDDYRAGEKCAGLLKPGEVKAAAMVRFQDEGKPRRLFEFGFMTVCKDKGLEIREEWNVVKDSCDYEAGYQAALEMFDKVPLPAVWVVMDCRMANGIMAACREREIRVPEQLRLLFFGESEMFPYNSPSLSSIEIPLADMAEKALDILVLTTENQIEIPIKRELLPIYHLRESLESDSI